MKEMLDRDKSSAIFLAIIFLINGECGNLASIAGDSKLSLRVIPRFLGNHFWNPENISTVEVNSKNVLKTNERYHIKGINHGVSTLEINNVEKRNVTKNIPTIKTLRKICPIRPRYLTKMPSKERSRSKFLEVFQIVEFEHVACTSSSGLDGTCLHEYDCQTSGGTGMGDCADGYGTCCVTQFSCDGTSAASMGWLNNPDFPSPTVERLSCTFTLEKTSEEIKQLRLDFATFELLPPSGGACQQDQFVVSGQNINNVVPILCGINTGQHVYIEVGDVKGPIYFSVQTVSAESRSFSIKITQLTQTDELAAPSGCLQYFKGPEGYLESFNYRDKSDIGITTIPSYFNNLNYAICISRESQTCSVTYTNDDEMQIVNYDSDGLPIIPPNQAGVEIFNCPSDWLLIAATRLCGDRLNDGSVLQDFTLNAPIRDTNAGPIVLWFRSDEGYVGHGFKIHYQQNSCLNPS